MRLSVISFGKLKTPGLRDAADYYSNLIKTWVPIEELELKPLAVPDKSPATRSKIQEKEAQLLLEKLSSKRSALYLLSEGGKAMSTQGWADLVRRWESEGSPEVALCVGSSLGFSATLLKRAHGVLSLGPHTLPHELARVVLLEQVYRAYSVTRGHPYHNEG